MSFERSVIKAQQAGQSTFDYKAREISLPTSNVAQTFANRDSMRSPDFKISELVAQQSGISKLENEALQDKINAQVLEKLKQVEEKGYQEGYDLGLIDGAEKAFQENKEILLNGLQKLDEVLRRIEAIKERLLIENEKELIHLVFLAAKRMALRDLQENPEAVWEVLKNVIGELQADEQTVVNISHEDLYFLQTLQEKGVQGAEALKRVKLVGSDAVTSGGCLITTEYGNVDATVEERVSRVWQALESRTPRHQPSEDEPK